MEILVNGEIVLYGAVGDDFWIDSFTDKDVMLALNELRANTEIIVRINSGGGDAFIGLAIYNALKSSPAKIIIYVDGIAASAASVIAMAADELVMKEGSMMMIHDPSSITFGDAADHAKSFEILDKLGDQMARIYSRKARDDADTIRQMMRDEKWLTSSEAVDLGFADATDDEHKAVTAALFDYRVYSNAPKNLITLATANASIFNKSKQLIDDERTEIMSIQIKPDENIETEVTEEVETADVIDVAAIAAQASAAERARITAITTDEAAIGRSDLAAHFAFQTDITVEAAVAALKASPKKSTEVATLTPVAKPAAQYVEPLETMNGLHASARKPIDVNAVYNQRNQAR